MPFTPTTFVNNQAPAINSTELNKLGTQYAQMVSDIPNSDTPVGAALAGASFQKQIQFQVPTGLGWRQDLWPVAPTINLTSDGRMVGSIGTTPEAMFDTKSTARSAPQATIYISGSGSDSNAGTNLSPYRTLRKAIQQINTVVPSGQSGMIVFKCNGEDLSWSHEYSFETDGVTYPARDISFTAIGGRPRVGPWINLIFPSINTTATNLATDPTAAGTAAFTTGISNATVATGGAIAGATSSTSAEFTVTATGTSTRISLGQTLGTSFPNAGQLVRSEFKVEFTNAANVPELSFRPSGPASTTGRITLREAVAVGDTIVHSYSYDFYAPTGATLSSQAGVWMVIAGSSATAGNKIRVTDIALRAVWTTADGSSPPILDTVYTNCYAVPYADYSRPPIRVVDLGNVDKDNVAPDLTMAASAALCNSTANTWYFITGTLDKPRGTLLVHRSDSLPVSNSNTLATVNKIGLQYQNNVNVWADGIDWLGGRGGGQQAISPQPLSTTPMTMVMKNCSYAYGGGWTTGNLDNNAISVVDWYGITAFFGCNVVSSMADAFNTHAPNSSIAHMLTVNCTGTRMGTNGTSRNGWTIHETAIGIDVAGRYSYSHGGTIHNIGTSKALFCGTTSLFDYGDKMFGGTIGPSQFRASVSAEIWLDYCIADGFPGAVAYDSAESGAKIHIRRPQPTRLSTINIGTVDSY